MAKDESIFNDIDDSVKVKVQLGNDSFLESKGKGVVMVETKKGATLIKDVLLVPNLKDFFLVLVKCWRKDILYTLKETHAQYMITITKGK